MVLTWPASLQRCRPRVRLVGSVAWIACAVMLPAATLPADDDREQLFETEIRPIFVEHCIQCHGADEQSGELRLDSNAAFRKGGSRGALIAADDPQSSLLLQAVRREGDLEMPPDDPLTDAQIDALTRWVQSGAYWPDTPPLSVVPSQKAADHWAFQPVTRPHLPETAGDPWVRNPVDAFVLARLQEAGLSPAPEADRRTLIRRLAYTLTGLPPDPDDVARFVNDDDPQAYERLVEHYLAAPQYGEHWARHWLDVARYSDTKGYVYAREERFWVHAWAYRDWIVRALNEDMPYDRFLMLQIAADQVPDRRQKDLAAMGFLTIGRRFLGVERDIIDDRIDVVTRGTMGLTVACARCHDHKYDPIPTADYYSLYGVFDSSREELVRLDEPGANDEAWEAELAARQDKLNKRLAEARAEWSERVRDRIGDYLQAQLELGKYPEQGFDQILEKDDILPEFVRRWRRALEQAERTGDPVFVPWHEYARLPAESFVDESAAATARLHEKAGEINPLVLAAFTTPPASMQEVVSRYAALFADIRARYASGGSPVAAVDDPAVTQLLAVLYGPESPCEVPDEPIVHTEGYFDSATCTELWGLQRNVDRWILDAPVPVAHALILRDRAQPREPRIFRRGNPATPGDAVPRQFLQVLSGPERRPFETGSGRYELARAIVDPANPLTSRVIVNRVWAHHFGAGLVRTASDFGTRAEPPSHPQLLDWLAATFVDGGWSLKELHRLILTSATFRQASVFAPESDGVARALRIDPENRLLWRMNAHRLTFEEFRDSMLAACGELDPALGGKPAELFAQPFPTRRTLYGLVDRQFLPGTLRMFDFANPDLHIPQRSETTVPQQALFVMNHPLVLQRAAALVKAVGDSGSPQERVRHLFRRVYQREPHTDEIAAALDFIAGVEPPQQPPPPPTAADWQYGYGTLDEQARRVKDFTPLPHFTGTAWQGGPDYPDATLGWVQLTARGGHPGNDRQHAAIRRWTAPRDAAITISYQLQHEPEAGDGIRAFVVSSRAGILASAKVHHSSTTLTLPGLTVAAGETIDFVVDIGDVLNSDQYLWKVTLEESPAAGTEAVTTWNSETDFTPARVEVLGAWEQLAQLLLCSNEFMFVD